MIHGRMSHRGARIERRRKRGITGQLSLTSMMDIFTILVFFLLVNSSDVEVLPNPKALQLPESIAQQQAKQALVLMVTEQDILVNNRKVMSVADASGADGTLLPALQAELARAPELPPQPGQAQAMRGEVNIMADKEIPYSLLKKVMATCTDARFAKISLAVLQKEGSA